MTQEEKELLLKDICARLPYGVKILHTGWDYDSDTDFDTVETLIGIDDRFIYTVWDKTGDREKHCLSVSNWKPYLRPLSSMTDEEKKELLKFGAVNRLSTGEIVDVSCVGFDRHCDVQDWLNSRHLDYRGLIPTGLAIEVTENNNPYKE